MINPDLVINDIMSLYETYGQDDYDGEPISQTSHMIQCAMLAMDEDADIELVLGAFFHDIGHMLGHRQKAPLMDNYGLVNHELIGADYLKEAGFSERICDVVDMHVQAKRYLVATESSYKEKLSEASWQTLQWQGGPMTSSEVEKFGQHPFFDDIIKVRLWDEEAKKKDAALIPLNTFRNLIAEHLEFSYNENRIGSI